MQWPEELPGPRVLAETTFLLRYESGVSALAAIGVTRWEGRSYELRPQLGAAWSFTRYWYIDAWYRLYIAAGSAATAANGLDQAVSVAINLENERLSAGLRETWRSPGTFTTTLSSGWVFNAYWRAEAAAALGLTVLGDEPWGVSQAVWGSLFWTATPLFGVLLGTGVDRPIDEGWAASIRLGPWLYGEAWTARVTVETEVAPNPGSPKLALYWDCRL